MDKQAITKVVIIFLVILILSQIVQAIGIAPGSTTINFKPGLEEVKFKIINNEQKDMRVILKAEGELAQYLTLPQQIITFSSTEKEKEFSYKVSLPSSMEKPGEHIIKIIAIELPPGAESKENFIGASVGVASKLIILVPFPGKYAEARLEISPKDVDEETDFRIKVYNFGQEDISSAQADIEIRDPEGNLLGTIQTNKLSIVSKQIGELTAKWVGQKIGVYKATAIVNYDGKRTQDSKDFYIGSLKIELLDVIVKNFRLGGVAKFELLVENQWNDLVKNVFAEITMSKDGQEIAKFKSTSSDMAALSQDTIIAYWDTTSINPGNYDATIAIGYSDGKRTEKQFNADVSIDSIKLSLVGATGEVVSSPTSGRSSLILVLVGLLTIFNIAWFIYFRRKSKNKQ